MEALTHDRRVLAKVRALFPAFDHARIERALNRIIPLYGTTMHPFMNMTYLDHVQNCADMVMEFCPDEDAIVACLLQHTLSVHGMTVEDLEEEFGKTVRELVSSIHLLFYLNINDRRRSIDDLKLMLISVSEDVRVVLIKLCTRAYVLENLDRVRKEHRLRACREALQLFAPVAARLGIYTLKHRIEYAAFPVVYPSDAERISEQLLRLHREHGKFLEQATTEIDSALRIEHVKVRVEGREKHPYSIFQKMRMKGVTSVEDIHDLFAIRVIVPTEADCYQALGLLHKIATPLSHRFKDYISFPKPNGYQSLHTCLIRIPGVPPNIKMEVQIRTEAMHRAAEYGIAAHWGYKEGRGVVRQAMSSLQLKSILDRQQIVPLGSSAKDQDPLDRIGLVDHMYVLTPRGDIIELPDGSTPLDFAFMIHSDIGLSFKAARVNGMIVPISHKLENGDVVEIITHKQPRPTLSWIEEVRTSSAKSKLKNYFAMQDRARLVTLGRDMLNAELRTRHLSVLDNDLRLLKTFDGVPLSMHEREDLLVKIGLKSIRTSTIFKHLDVPTEVVRKLPSKRPERTSRKQHIIEIVGGPTMPVRFAKCCNADVAGKKTDIVGFVTRTGDVSVHKKTCRMMKNANKERMVEVRWN